jgi:hypothetical protein
MPSAPLRPEIVPVSAALPLLAMFSVDVVEPPTAVVSEIVAPAAGLELNSGAAAGLPTHCTGNVTGSSPPVASFVSKLSVWLLVLALPGLHVTVNDWFPPAGMVAVAPAPDTDSAPDRPVGATVRSETPVLVTLTDAVVDAPTVVARLIGVPLFGVELHSGAPTGGQVTSHQVLIVRPGGNFGTWSQVSRPVTGAAPAVQASRMVPDGDHVPGGGVSVMRDMLKPTGGTSDSAPAVPLNWFTEHVTSATAWMLTTPPVGVPTTSKVAPAMVISGVASLLATAPGLSTPSGLSGSGFGAQSAVGSPDASAWSEMARSKNAAAERVNRMSAPRGNPSRAQRVSGTDSLTSGLLCKHVKRITELRRPPWQRCARAHRARHPRNQPRAAPGG